MPRDPLTSVVFDETFVGPPAPFTEERFEQTKAEVTRLMEPLDPATRHRVADKLLTQFETERHRHEASIAENRRRLERMDELKLWFEKPVQLALEKNDCTRLHRLKECAATGRIIGNDAEPLDKSESLRHIEHTFVVRHNWAAAFEHADGIEDNFRLPYDVCAFEFRVDGHNVIAVAVDEPRHFTSLVEVQDYWYAYGSEKNATDPLIQFMWAQIRAICIALDAEVATHSVVRAPHKLNEKREKQGKPAVADFHVIDLAKRHRVANPSGAAGLGTKKRLHFRRGHWRHFETTKTWVRWCLVGDPDLGFIQKSYTL